MGEVVAAGLVLVVAAGLPPLAPLVPPDAGLLLTAGEAAFGVVPVLLGDLLVAGVPVSVLSVLPACVLLAGELNVSVLFNVVCRAPGVN